MGSLSKVELAYIAGFLDGDGSLMLQIKKRKDGRLKRRFMLTICFYQDSRHEEYLHWIRKVFGIGYISRRNDGMTELRINGFEQVRNILAKLAPFIRFKEKQAEALLRAATLLSRKDGNKLATKDLRELVNCMVVIQTHNYATKNKRSKEELLKILDLAP